MGSVQSRPEDIERFMMESAGSAVRDKLGETHRELYRILKSDDNNIIRRPSEEGAAQKEQQQQQPAAKSNTAPPVKATGVRVSLIAELCSVPNDSLNERSDMDDYFLVAKQRESPMSQPNEEPVASVSRQNSSPAAEVCVSEATPVSAVENVVSAADPMPKQQRRVNTPTSVIGDQSPSSSPRRSTPQHLPTASGGSNPGNTTMHDIYVDLFKTTEERMRDLLQLRAKQRLQAAAAEESNQTLSPSAINADSSHSNRLTTSSVPTTPKTPYDKRITASYRGAAAAAGLQVRTAGSMLPMLLGDLETSEQRSALASFDRNYPSATPSKESGSVVRCILGEPASTSLTNLSNQQHQQLQTGTAHRPSTSSSASTIKELLETKSTLATNIYPWQRDFKSSTADVRNQPKLPAAALPNASRLSPAMNDIPLDLSAKHDECAAQVSSSQNIPLLFSSKSTSSSPYQLTPIDSAVIAAKLAAHLIATTNSSSSTTSSSSTSPKLSSLTELVALPSESRRQVLGSMLSTRSNCSSASSATATADSLRYVSQMPTEVAERGRSGLSNHASRLLATSDLPGSSTQSHSQSGANASETAAEEEAKKQLPSHQDHIFRATAIRRGGPSYYPEAGVGKKSTYFQRGFAANSASLAAKQKQQQQPPHVSSNLQQRPQQQQAGSLGESSRNAASTTGGSSATGGSSGSTQRSTSSANVNILRQLSPNGARALQSLQQGVAAAQATQKEETLKRMASGASNDLATLLGARVEGQQQCGSDETVVATVQYAGGASNTPAVAQQQSAKNLPSYLQLHQQQQQMPRESNVRSALQQKLTAGVASDDRVRNEGLSLRERLSVATDREKTTADLLTLTSNKSTATGQQQGAQPLKQQQLQGASMDSKSRVAMLLGSSPSQVVSTSTNSQLRQPTYQSGSTASNTAATAVATNNRALSLVFNNNNNDSRNIVAQQKNQPATALQAANNDVLKRPLISNSKPMTAAERKPSSSSFNSGLRRLDVGDRYTPKSSAQASSSKLSHAFLSVNASPVVTSSSSCSSAADSASSCAVPLKRRWLASATNDTDVTAGPCGRGSDGEIADEDHSTAAKRRCNDSTTGRSIDDDQ